MEAIAFLLSKAVIPNCIQLWFTMRSGRGLRSFQLNLRPIKSTFLTNYDFDS